MNRLLYLLAERTNMPIGADAMPDQTRRRRKADRFEPVQFGLAHLLVLMLVSAAILGVVAPMQVSPWARLAVALGLISMAAYIILRAVPIFQRVAQLSRRRDQIRIEQESLARDAEERKRRLSDDATSDT